MSQASGKQAREEVLDLGHLIARELGGPEEGPGETSLACALQAALGDDQTASGDAVRFVTRWILEHGGAEGSPDRLANRAAFLWLTLRPSGALGELVRRSALRAYRGTAGALQPFLEKEDFFELVRWRLWKVPTRQFDPEGVLRPTGLAGFVATVCRRLAIDQIRRLAKRQTEPLADDLDSSIEAPNADVETQVAAYHDIERAIRVAGAGHPEWLVRGVVAVLSESRDREGVLAEINHERERAGEEPWTPGAFNTFLYRFRKHLREALSAD